MGGCIAWLDGMLIQNVTAVGLGGTLNNPQYLRDRRLSLRSTYTRAGGSGFMTLQATLGSGWQQGVQLAALFNVNHIGGAGASITCTLKNNSGTVTYASKTMAMPPSSNVLATNLVALFDQWYPAQRVEWQWNISGSTTLLIGRMWASPCIYRKRGLQVGWGNQIQDTTTSTREGSGVVIVDTNNRHRVITATVPDLSKDEAFGTAPQYRQSIHDLGTDFGRTAEAVLVPTTVNDPMASMTGVLGTLTRDPRLAHGKGELYRAEFQLMENL